MRVAYVTMQFPAPSETFATNEVRALVSRGVVLSVHCLRSRRDDSNDLAAARGVGEVEVTYNGIAASLRGALAAARRPLLLVRAWVWLIRTAWRAPRDLMLCLLLTPRAFDILAEIESRRPDVVHMFWGHLPTVVGYLVQSTHPWMATSLSLIAYDLERRFAGTIAVAHSSDVVRTHASANVAQVAEFTGIDPNRISVIFDGIDVGWIDRTRRGIARVPFRLLATGRLIPEKGMDDVLKAFAGVRERWPEATLAVAGDGPDRDRLMALRRSLGLGESVQFLGHVAHARVIEEMARAQVFLLLSRYGGERLPNVVKEAMACGCVCITTPTPGIEELVESGVTGYVVEGSDADSVVSIVDALFAKRVEAQSMSQAAASIVADRFDLSRTAPMYLTLWRVAVAKRAECAPNEQL